MENLISRPQLRSRRDQGRRKLAIFTKKKAVFDISCKEEPWINKSCELMTKPRSDANSGANETNIDGNKQSSWKKYTVFDISCKDEPWKNKRCKLMTKPRRYCGKPHPATPTQEQTRPISTETSNLNKKYAVSDICCVNGLCRNKALQIDDQTAQIWWKISYRDANAGADETNDDGN